MASALLDSPCSPLGHLLGNLRHALRVGEFLLKVGLGARHFDANSVQLLVHLSDPRVRFGVLLLEPPHNSRLRYEARRLPLFKSFPKRKISDDDVFVDAKISDVLLELGFQPRVVFLERLDFALNFFVKLSASRTVTPPFATPTRRYSSPLSPHRARRRTPRSMPWPSPARDPYARSRPTIHASRRAICPACAWPARTHPKSSPHLSPLRARARLRRSRTRVIAFTARGVQFRAHPPIPRAARRVSAACSRRDARALHLSAARLAASALADAPATSPSGVAGRAGASDSPYRARVRRARRLVSHARSGRARLGSERLRTEPFFTIGERGMSTRATDSSAGDG